MKILFVAMLFLINALCASDEKKNVITCDEIKQSLVQRESEWENEFLSEPEKQLNKAIREDDDVERIKRIIMANKTLLNSKCCCVFWDKQTALCKAVHLEREETVGFLVAMGANVSDDGAQLLFNSMKEKSLMRKILLVAGAPLRSDYPYDCLKLACNWLALDVLQDYLEAGLLDANEGLRHIMSDDRIQCTSLLKFFLDRGASVDLRDEQQRTPLHLTAQAGNLDAVSFLRNRKADIYAIDKSGDMPIVYAHRREKIYDWFEGEHEQIEELLNRADLIRSVKEGRLGRVKYLFGDVSQGMSFSDIKPSLKLTRRALKVAKRQQLKNKLSANQSIIDYLEAKVHALDARSLQAPK